MIYFKKIILFILILLCGKFLFAQKTISLDDAIKLALQNNYGIQIAQNESEISKINNDFGNAGFLPQLDASAGNSKSNYHLHQETSTGVVSDYNNVTGNNLTSSVGFSWTLFDGTKMFATRNKLNELQKLSEYELQSIIENTVYQVINQYYTLIKLKQQIALSESLLMLFEKRKQVSEAKNSNGSSSGLEVLQAQADYNAQNAILMKLQSQYIQAQYSFASLITNNPQSQFQVSDSISMSPLINIETIRANLKQQNINLKMASSGITISNYTIKEARSAYFPRLGFGANYNFANNDVSVGSVLNNQTYGMNYGITASWNLFDGLSVKRSVKTAKIRQKMMQLSFNEVNLQLETTLLCQYKLYESNLQIVNMEEQNIVIAQKALNIAMEKYSIGVINDIQLKDAQRTFEDAQLRLIQARYDAKMSETGLLKLQGLLVQ